MQMQKFLFPEFLSTQKRDLLVSYARQCKHYEMAEFVEKPIKKDLIEVCGFVLNTLRLGQMAYILKFILLKEKLCILIKLSLKFVPISATDNWLTICQVMVWQ